MINKSINKQFRSNQFIINRESLRYVTIQMDCPHINFKTPKTNHLIKHAHDIALFP